MALPASMNSEYLRAQGHHLCREAPLIEARGNIHTHFSDFSPTRWASENGNRPSECAPVKGKRISTAYLMYVGNHKGLLVRARVGICAILDQTIISKSFCRHHGLSYVPPKPGARRQLKTPYGMIDADCFVKGLEISARHLGISPDGTSYKGLVLPFDMTDFDMILGKTELETLSRRHHEFGNRCVCQKLACITQTSFDREVWQSPYDTRG